ncbi:hypothetical protein CYY_003475 [Polysphondylium violaceum]|uniref:Cysteine protease n=1 Tax=Polysphondylium violaceum TaxID=133409 RepID=A0A8J4PYD2_9MYCE|nr:hypothetical protein CYY_003475 [Polysphondylium violaceum]
MFGREYKFDGGTSYHPLNLVPPQQHQQQEHQQTQSSIVDNGEIPIINNSNNSSNNSDGAAQVLPSTQDQLFIQEFLEDFSSSVLWFTYRQGFPYIEGTSFESDRGWGCMLRSGQMLLSNLILHHVLGDQWRKSSPIKNQIVYADIIKLFLDQPSSPFSIHNIALEGQKLGKNIGEWFAPSIISQAIKNLVSKNYQKCNISVFISEDGSLYIDQLLNISTKQKSNNNNNNQECNLEERFKTDINLNAQHKTTEQSSTEKEYWEPLLILIPTRLGLEGLNSVYHSSLLEIFKFPQNLGVVGGKPRASLYFVAAQDDNLFYLDPHTVQNNIPESTLTLDLNQQQPNQQQQQQQPPSQLPYQHPLSTFFCTSPKRTHVSEVDPSLVVAFFCNSYNDFMDFVERSKKMQTQFENPIFSIFDNEPDYKQDRSMSMSTSCSSSLSDQSVKNDDIIDQVEDDGTVENGNVSGKDNQSSIDHNIVNNNNNNGSVEDSSLKQQHQEHQEQKQDESGSASDRDNEESDDIDGDYHLM